MWQRISTNAFKKLFLMRIFSLGFQCFFFLIPTSCSEVHDFAKRRMDLDPTSDLCLLVDLMLMPFRKIKLKAIEIKFD